MPLLCQAVKNLERINSKVIAASTVRLSQNLKLFRIHKHLVGDSDTKIVYHNKNIYNKEMRHIYFFSDVLHLMKTIRNCRFYSGSGRGRRFM